jgi:aerobic-type carbon monoxide dehydrogenase small subunit (CoxS/CutS family)
MPRQPIRLVVNGVVRPLDVDPETTLLAVLRDELDLTGAKYGCGEGRCGACTVLVDNEPAHACLVKVGLIADKAVRTIEGLAPEGALHPVQQAFLDAGAFQCGYCTPGMILAAVGLLERTPRPSDDQIVAAMDGNICRCGTYRRIVRAVQAASDTLAGGTTR